MTDYKYKLDDGDDLVVVIHTGLNVESIYDHMVRTGIYNIIRSAIMTTTASQDVMDEFMKELK